MIDFRQYVPELVNKLARKLDKLEYMPQVYFVPNAGYKVAALLENVMKGDKFITVFDPFKADVIVDDIIDSGETITNLLYSIENKEPRNTQNRFPLIYCLVNKHKGFKDSGMYTATESEWNEWFLLFDQEQSGIQSNVKRLLQYIGEDVTREGLLDTPKRVEKSFDKLYGGYKQNAEDILKTSFTEDCNEMVVLKDCEFYSTCEHHMQPFFGRIHIAYIPGDTGQVVGISKLARLVEVYSRRLQIQERLVNEIATAIARILLPKGVIVVAEAQHFCMTSRGVEKQNSKMVTSAIRGAFKAHETRSEFLSLIGGK